MSALDDHNIQSSFKKGKFFLIDVDIGKQIGRGFKNCDGLFHVLGLKLKPEKFVKGRNTYVAQRKQANLNLWHQRFGRTSLQVVEKILAKDVVKGIDPRETIFRIECPPCSDRKQFKKKLSGKLINEFTQVGDVILSDVCGPLDSPPWSNAVSIVAFIDGASRYVSVSTIVKNNETVKQFMDFEAKFELQWNKEVRRLHTDSSGKYINRETELICSRTGVVYTTTSSYNPQSNGMAERMNRTLLDKVRSILSHVSLGKKFWTGALHHAAYLENVLLSRDRKCTPVEMFNGSNPDAGHLRTLGCLVQELVSDS